MTPANLCRCGSPASTVHPDYQVLHITIRTRSTEQANALEGCSMDSAFLHEEALSNIQANKAHIWTLAAVGLCFVLRGANPAPGGLLSFVQLELRRPISTRQPKFAARRGLSWPLRPKSGLCGLTAGSLPTSQYSRCGVLSLSVMLSGRRCACSAACTTTLDA